MTTHIGLDLPNCDEGDRFGKPAFQGVEVAAGSVLTKGLCVSYSGIYNGGPFSLDTNQAEMTHAYC